MKPVIEGIAIRMGTLIQDICANVDFEVFSLPGGSLIAVLLSLHAIAMGFIRRAATQIRAARTRTEACSGSSSRLLPKGACVYCGCFCSGRPSASIANGRQFANGASG
jgi:hypothetical protein